MAAALFLHFLSFVPVSAPLILALETSCDETAVAITRGGEVLASEISSQIALHQPYGGVVPELASRSHLPPNSLVTVAGRLMPDPPPKAVAWAAIRRNTSAMTQDPMAK